MSKKHMGSSVDGFLKEEGVFEEAQTQAVKEVVAWQLVEAMRKRRISKNKMAMLLKTSRTQVDRLLDANDDITLSSLRRAAAIVGRWVVIELVQRSFLKDLLDQRARHLAGSPAARDSDRSAARGSPPDVVAGAMPD